MKKNIICLLFVVLSCGVGLAQTTFGFVEKFGFSSLNNGNPDARITSLVEFKGKMYVTTGNNEGHVYRSATGDPGSFQLVYSDLNYESTFNLVVTNDGPTGGYIYMIANGQFGISSKVLRSSDGNTWEDYFICPGLASAGIQNITLFKGTGVVDSVYITTIDFPATNIYRAAVDANDPDNLSSSFTLITDVNAQFGYQGITCSLVSGDTMYYSVSSSDRIIKTANGTSFHENTRFTDSIANNYSNSQVTAMVEFNSYIYYITHSSFGTGTYIWKSNDGTNFTLEETFNADTLGGAVAVCVAGGKLWIVGRTDNDYTTVFSTVNGSDYVLENADEFGYPDNNSNDGAGIIEFNDHVYIGVASYAGGGKRLKAKHNEVNGSQPPPAYSQIWRTCLTGTMPVISFSGAGDTTVCAGNSVTIIAASGFSNYMWSNANTSQFLSTNTPGYYSVTVDDVNGCRNSAGYMLNNFETLPAFFTDSLGNTPLTGITICEGNTSNTLLVHPENDAYALKIPGQDQGMVSPGSNAFASRQITIELWMKPSTNNNGQVMTEYDVNGTWGLDNHDLIEYYGNIIYLELPGIGEFSLDSVISANEWSHVVLRYDGSVLTGFFNGTLSSGSSSGTWQIPDSNLDAFKIGYGSQSGVGTAESFLGTVKDVRIWNSARSDGDIAANMNSLTPGVYPDLIYHYMMNEGTGSVANDISGNNNNSVSVSGVFVSPESVTVVPAAGLTNMSGNYYAFHPSQTTTYSAFYTNSLGCVVDSSTFVVTVPKVNFTGSLPAVCGGLDANITMGTPGSYTITPSVIDLNPNFTPSPQPVAPTWYYVSGFSSDGNCALNDSILINVGPSFNSNVGNPPPIFACEETDVTIDVMASGGTAPYTYFWQKSGSTYKDTTYVDSLTFYLGGTSEIITATGVDGIGCPMSPPVTFSVTPTSSTDLFGHVTTSAPANVDNGFVYVFKHQPGNAVLDSVGYTSLDANGNYLFTPLIAGDYLIKVLPDETDFPLVVPTYYGNAFQWDSSLVYTHGCAQNDTANIQVVESTVYITGSGHISGFINEEDTLGGNRLLGPGVLPNIPFVPGGPLKGVDVKLGKNPGGGIQARTMTDSTGYYEFDSLPIGGYIIYVDIPNLPMDSTRSVVISGPDSSVQNNYWVDTLSIYINPDTITFVGIYSSEKQYENKFSIYPNPAKDVLYVNYELEKESKVAFEITNVFGQVVKYEQPRKYPEGKNTFIFNIDELNLNGGVYFISILNDNKKYTQRVVVIE